MVCESFELHSTTQLTWPSQGFGLLYFWVFLAEAVSLFAYGFVLIYLEIKHIRLKRAGLDTTAAARASLAPKCMMIYPMFYIFFSLPDATARMQAWAGTGPSDWLLQIGGLLLACNGWANGGYCSTSA